MPSLAALLNAHDLGFLQALADAWGLPCAGRNAQELAACLSREMLATGLLQEMLQTLPPRALEALAFLKSQGGSLPWPEFTRRFGELRPMGPARRSREQPWRFPASVTEQLWYPAFIGRDFLRSSAGPLEAAYIPEEFLEGIPAWEPEALPAPPAPLAVPPQAAAAPILEDSCTLLAALRRQNSERLAAIAGLNPEHQALLGGFLQGLGLLGKDGKSPTAAARPFLEQNRAQALAWVVQTWQGSRGVNELRLVPSLCCEGTWQNDPLPPRRLLIERLAALTAPVSLKSFIQSFKDNAFSFLRPPVESAHWMIASSAEPRRLLRGPNSWDEVEGAWLRMLLTRIMPWMGLVVLEGPPVEEMLSKSASFDELLQGGSAAPAPEDDQVKVDPGGMLSISAQVPRIARYQLSRFGAWLPPNAGEFRYQISAAALEEAAAQGLSVKHLLSLLRKYAKSTPQALARSLRQWESKGNLIKLQNLRILRLAQPELLPKLREGPAGKFLGEALGPDAVVVKAGSLAALQKALLRAGYLAALPEDPDQND